MCVAIVCCVAMQCNAYIRHTGAFSQVNYDLKTLSELTFSNFIVCSHPYYWKKFPAGKDLVYFVMSLLPHSFLFINFCLFL